MRTMTPGIRQQMSLPFFVVVPIGHDGRRRTPVDRVHGERRFRPLPHRDICRLMEIQPPQMLLAGMRAPLKPVPEFIAERHTQ